MVEKVNKKKVKAEKEEREKKATVGTLAGIQAQSLPQLGR